jgi:hypothetical protein
MGNGMELSQVIIYNLVYKYTFVLRITFCAYTHRTINDNYYMLVNSGN